MYSVCISTYAGVNNACILNLKNGDFGGAAVSQ